MNNDPLSFDQENSLYCAWTTAPGVDCGKPAPRFITLAFKPVNDNTL